MGAPLGISVDAARRRRLCLAQACGECRLLVCVRVRDICSGEEGVEQSGMMCLCVVVVSRV